jgi:hypothetical protein
MEASARVIRTFVVRLLMDRGEPHILRGAVQSVASGQEHPFSDGPTLLALLCQMAGERFPPINVLRDETADHEKERSEP